MYKNIHLTKFILKKITVWILFVLFISGAIHVVFLAGSVSASVQSLSAGNETTCDIFNGRVKCWGDNSEGQLGNGTIFGYKTTPQDVYAKDAYSEVIRECSGVKIGSWCSGNWSDKTIKYPATALGGKKVTKVSVGKTHVCAVASARAYCWGDNSEGQLGNRSNSRSLVPVAVDTALAVKKKCEQYSSGGSLCLRYNVSSDRPESALERKEVIDISAGDEFSCALASDGTVACWGKNDKGQLGEGAQNLTNKNYPVKINYNKKITKLAQVKGSVSSMCAVNTSEDAVCWGDNSLGVASSRGDGLNSGSGTGHNRQSSSNRCGNASRAAYRIAAADLPYATYDTGRSSSVSRIISEPSEQRSYVKFSELTLYGDGSVAMESIPYLTSVGKRTSETSLYTYVSALSTTGKVYWWGGNVTQLTTIDCYSNGATYYGERTESDVDVKQIVTSRGGGSAAGPLYISDGVGAVKNQQLALLAGNARMGIHFTPICKDFVEGGFVKKTVSVCEAKPSTYTCVTPAASLSNVYCDDGSEACTDNSDGSTLHIALLKATGKYVQTCLSNGPKALKIGAESWLQSTLRLKNLAIGFSNYACAATENSAGCWGANSKGQLGVGDSRFKQVPTKTQ